MVAAWQKGTAAVVDDSFEKKRTDAKNSGKDYVVYDYPSFHAKFAQCVHCEWVEYLTENWRDDDKINKSLFTHTVSKHRPKQKEGDYLDGSHE